MAGTGIIAGLKQRIVYRNQIIRRFKTDQRQLAVNQFVSVAVRGLNHAVFVNITFNKISARCTVLINFGNSGSARILRHICNVNINIVAAAIIPSDRNVNVFWAQQCAVGIKDSLNRTARHRTIFNIKVYFPGIDLSLNFRKDHIHRPAVIIRPVNGNAVCAAVNPVGGNIGHHFGFGCRHRRNFFLINDFDIRRRRTKSVAGGRKALNLITVSGHQISPAVLGQSRKIAGPGIININMGGITQNITEANCDTVLDELSNILLRALNGCDGIY